MKLANALLATALLATPAFAGGSGGLTFDQIKDACQNPSKYQNQIAPTSLQITCEEHVTSWVPYVSKEMQLPRSRYIVSSLTSNKYQVSPSTNAMNVDMQTAQCPSFKETLEVTSFTKDTTCEELLGWNGTEQDLCADILDKARQANPKLVQINDTGKIVEFCSQGEEQGKGKGEGQGEGQGKGK